MNVELFKTTAKKYLEIDNEINKYKNLIKLKREQKEKLKIYLLQFMGQNKMKDLKTPDGKLKYTITKVKKPLNKIIINKTLKEYFLNDEKAEELTTLLYNKRENIEKIDLKRTIKKN